MKKRIIAALLVAIMTVLTLVGCGFDLSKDDLSDYIEGEFDVNKFMEAIRNIEIEDGEYTTNSEINDKVIASDVYGPIANGAIADAESDGKTNLTDADDVLTAGKIGATDVVYFCYYVSYKGEDGKVRIYKSSEMNETSITASATKSKHFIKLGNYVKDQDSFEALLAKALLEKGDDVKYYSMMDKATVTSKLGADALKVTKDYTVAVSYTVKYKGANDSDITEKVAYEFVNLQDADNKFAVALASYIGKEGSTIKIGEKVQVVDETTENKAKVGYIKDADGKTYSDITVNYLVDKNVAAGEEITFNYKDTSFVALSPDNMDGVNDASATAANLSDKEVTFHVYPVFRVQVPESNAESILEYVYAKKLADYLKGTTTGFGYGSSLVSVLNEVLTDAEYKYTEGETTKTLKELTDALAKLWSNNFEGRDDLKALEDARKAANDAVTQALKDKENAAAADNAAKEEIVKEKEAALKAAEKALDDALKAAIRADIKKIASAKKGELVLGTELLKTLDHELRHDRKEEYDSYITKEVAKAVYKIIDNQIKVVSYPKDLEKDFYDHIYDSYEYTFYNGNYTPEGATASTQSNYLQYGGDFKEFLKAQTKATDDDGIKAAITKQAQEELAPLIKIYVVAQALDEYDFGGKSADELLTDYVEKDIEVGYSDFKAYVYYSSYFKTYYFDDETLTDKENDKKEKTVKENAEKNVENALEAAEDFLMDNKAFRVYKKQLGNKNYRAQENSYGEINIRAGLQLNKLFYLLTSTDKTVTVDEEEQHVHPEVNYVERDGVKYHSYRLIQYKTK